MSVSMNSVRTLQLSKKVKFILLCGCLTIVVSAVGFAYSAIHNSTLAISKLPRQRTYRVKEESFPRDVVKIMEVKNISSANFPDDFEVVIKNVGEKKIYGFTLRISFPNAKRNNIRIGTFMRYGQNRLFAINEMKNDQDVPLEVGETATLKLGLDRLNALRIFLTQGEIPIASFDEMVLYCNTINFGDGTGYMNSMSITSTKVRNSSVQHKRGNRSIYKPSGTNIFQTSFSSRSSNTKYQYNVGCGPWTPTAPNECYATCFPDKYNPSGVEEVKLCYENVGCQLGEVNLDCFSDYLATPPQCNGGVGVDCFD